MGGPSTITGRLFGARRRSVVIGAGLGLAVASIGGLSALALNPWSSGLTNVAVAPSFSPPADIPPGTDTILAVGDITVCGTSNDEMTGELVESLPGTILGLGDMAYEAGTEREFERCFEPSWGAVKARIRPVPGNHEFETAGAGPYYEYFGDAAGTPGLGWYSFDIGEWHVIALNSNCLTTTNLCSDDSAQGDWLEADLARHSNQCTLAFMHRPRWSSGEHGGDSGLGELWTMLADGGVEVLLTAHDHNYERFAPMDANGVADPVGGMREFVVGTGGRSLDPFVTIQPNSEARNNLSYGVLQMALYEDSFTWEFIPVDADGYRDAGSGTCH
jgi:acid phosphatase type 7